MLTFILTMGIATSQIYLMQKFNKEVVLPKVLQNSNDMVNLTVVTELEKDLRKSERFVGSGNWHSVWLFIHQ